MKSNFDVLPGTSSKYSRNELIRKFYVPMLFLVLLILATIITGGSFLGGDNIFNVAERASIVGIVAIGQTLVILTGGIDLSVSAIMTVGFTIQATMAEAGTNPGLAALIAIIVCALIGLINGLLISRTKIPPFMVTLSTSMIFNALAIFLTKAKALRFYQFQDFINNGLNLGNFGARLLPTFTWLVLTLLVFVIFIKTKLGVNVPAIGGNSRAAFLSGVKANRTLILIYVLSGIFSALAALILGYRLAILNPHSAESFLLESIAAVVIGGTNTSGGEGSLLGTLFGAVIIAMLVNLMNILMVNTYLQFAIKGLLLLLIVAQVQLLSKRKS